MRQAVFCVSAALDRIALWLCLAATALLTVMILIIVVMRYGFGQGHLQLQDLASYAFAVLVAFSVPVCLAREGHVRVEVFSEHMPAAYRYWADVVALLLFLIPVFGLLIWAWAPQLAYSWAIREASLETGGLGGLFLVKTALPVAAAMTIVQGIALVLRKRQGQDGA
ncbi:TRAP transporter small permease subunit [Pseudorhodobacter sp.]|uniref:TRAP transporter small permease subunit n=1 Tax=Pseudorhodobacter sp. TaxID=1934400 RepID=UPI002647F617|nr:TRAP transporter small permease subunit [Pseudorhodobacter sp.]MDN5787855.1 TRAP transporter small permease subunit [Pseudorhodobacter sp.]